MEYNIYVSALLAFECWCAQLYRVYQLFPSIRINWTSAFYKVCNLNSFKQSLPSSSELKSFPPIFVEDEIEQLLYNKVIRGVANVYYSVSDTAAIKIYQRFMELNVILRNVLKRKQHRITSFAIYIRKFHFSLHEHREQRLINITPEY